MPTRAQSRKGKTTWGLALFISVIMLAVGAVSMPEATARPEKGNWNDPGFKDPVKPKAPSPPTVLSVVPDKQLQARINNSEGFCGGDAAYSIKLKDGLSLWVFGDSFRGTIKNGKRVNNKMEHNCVAVDDQNKATGKLKYYFGKRDFFICREENGTNYYWPGDGLVLDGSLYLFLHTVANDRSLPPPFQFKMRDNHFLQVQNPLDPPDKWRARIIPMHKSAAMTLWAAACYREGDYVYLYNADTSMALGFFRNPTTICRIKTADLKAANFDKVEWWDGQWRSEKLAPEVLFEDGASEMSVSKIEGLPGLFCFYIPADKSALMVRHAMQPQGPWSKRQLVYTFPKDAELLYYSAKAHPQYSKGKGKIKITYNDNALHLKRLVEDAKVYFPKALEVTLK